LEVPTYFSLLVPFVTNSLVLVLLLSRLLVGALKVRFEDILLV
jgi:hypothetical protein